ncbi:MAG: tetratricopeptide (TPR) repeat protein [Polaribacter sp.]|jgi:tetratricopeptide (TPR) repeat protein
MRIIISTHFFFFFLCFCLKAQYLHTPTQIETIKKESTIDYQLDSVVPSLAETPAKIISFFYETVVFSDTSLSNLITSKLSKKELKFLKKGDLFYRDKKYKEAITQYQKSEKLSQHPYVMARIAFSFQQSDHHQDAITVYTKLLTTDISNAFIYLQLANCYHQQEEYKMASRQVTLAHLFNRNNTAYLDTLSKIYKSQSWKFRALDFNPIYEIKSTDMQVQIRAAAEPWIAYASVKAIWAYEPGYLEKMKYLSSEDSRIIEEKEALFNALVVYEKLEAPAKIDFPGLYTLSHALPEKRVNDFIMYEISLREHPEITAQLSEERLEQLIDYVYTYRVKAMEVSQ